MIMVKQITLRNKEEFTIQPTLIFNENLKKCITKLNAWIYPFFIYSFI